LDGAKNAGILAAQIIGSFDETIAENLEQYKAEMKLKVENSIDQVAKKGWKA